MCIRDRFDADALIYAEVVVVTIFRHLLHELLTNLIVQFGISEKVSGNGSETTGTVRNLMLQTPIWLLGSRKED